jgi:coenzyme F420-reducing hydrogenase delta subunit
VLTFVFFIFYCIEPVELDEVEFDENLRPEEVEEYKQQVVAWLGIEEEQVEMGKIAAAEEKKIESTLN